MASAGFHSVVLGLISYQATALAVLSPGLTFTARVPMALAHKAVWSAQCHAEAFPPGHRIANCANFKNRVPLLGPSFVT